jgi:hypothetical protein
MSLTSTSSTAEPILQRKDALIFLAIADSFCAQTTQRWAQRFDRENWQGFVRQTEDLLKRFGITGMDDLALLTPPSDQEHTAFTRCYFVPEKAWTLIPQEQFYRRGVSGRSCKRALAGGGSGSGCCADGGSTGNDSVDGSSASGGSMGGNGDYSASGVGSDGGSCPASGTVVGGELAPIKNHQHETLLASVGAHLAKSLDESADHFSVMLTYLAFLVHNSLLDEAHHYLCNHFEWLPEYRSALTRVAPYACFYALLLDLIIRIRNACLESYYWRYSCQR